MKLRTVQDLKAYLQIHSLSPERFSALCGISNMTVRRWVKNDKVQKLPSKYWPMFDHAFVANETSLEGTAHVFSFQDGFSDLEKHVHALGENAASESNLKVDFTEKTNDKTIGQGLIDKVKLLFQALTSPQISHYHRTLVLGAIVYFISPVDLIPDVTPVIGYLDDYAVVTMVLTTVGPALVMKTPKKQASKDSSDSADV
jgi:uncharacterized membrane protein YkvA (DUF1232 family)